VIDMRDALRGLLALVLMLGLWTAIPAGAFAQGDGAQPQPRAAWPTTRSGTPAAAPQAAAPEPGSWRSWLMDVQHKLHTQLAAAVRGMKAEGNAWLAAATLVGLSFLYGVFHAAGPGHGKAVISSYVVANRQTVRRGIILSFLSSLVQALSAIGLVSVLAIGMNAAGLEIKQAVRQFEIASSALIVLAGAWLLLVQLLRFVPAFRASAVAAGGHGVSMPVPDTDHGHHHHHHEHGAPCDHAHMPLASDLEGPWSVKQAAAVVLAVGIRPCTGAILVLIFALSQGMFWAGVLATFAMALGTAITVSALAVLAVGSRDTAAMLVGGRWADRIYSGAGVLGALLVLLFGVALLYGAIYHPSPF
jgi:ABC-type nickel/cobalt efflux system permease component RcnA